MKKYLLDTNICIYFLKGLYNLDERIEKGEIENCFVSEINVAELKFGVENSENRERNRKTVDEFVGKFTIIRFSIPSTFTQRRKQDYAKEDFRLPTLIYLLARQLSQIS
ncbi:MAG: PIN domain-containing protein [Cyclobacteriaceae bacterium]|nr:PIN domain-containing protein [Cyclobacteriaceae bacterium]